MSDNNESAQPKAAAKSYVTLNTLMMPEHANHFGNVHGGVVMKLADEAAAISAMRYAGRPAVTVAIDSMSFKEPISVGDLVTCEARVSYTRHSSMEVEVEVSAEDPISGHVTHTNSAFFVFVALGPDGRPSPVPPLLLESAEDEERFQEGAQRQELRLRALKKVRAFVRPKPDAS